MKKILTRRLKILLVILLLALAGLAYFWNTTHVYIKQVGTTTPKPAPSVVHTTPTPVLDTVLYDKKLLENANLPPIPEPKKETPVTTKTPVKKGASLTTTSKPVTPKPVAVATPKPSLWPVKTAYPKAGALLPFNRIVAYYGNFYSKGMGVLGEYPKDEMLQRLQTEVDAWKAADPTTPVVPAIDYIAVTAQGSKGADGKYRLRMPSSQIDHAVELAHQVHGIVILDIQVGLSTVQTEVPLLEKYLKMPDVTLALDPEFSMKNGEKPGSVIGTMDASDINYAAQYLAKLVQENNLPPKILVLHRFTEDMITNYKMITPLPEVQMVMDMDGWGNPAKKLGTYHYVVYKEPVQFTGFKLFYKNDLFAPSTRMLTPLDLMKLSPRPLFIQYQ